MKDDDVLPVSTPTAHMSYTPATSSSSKKETNLFKSSLFGRGRYKFWALAAILLLAFCSMLAGTVTLRLSIEKFNRFIDDIGTPVHDDLDVLEMEEREKVVKHMWDVYTNSRRIRIPRFWQEAFEAAHEELTSDIAEVREAAISEKYEHRAGKSRISKDERFLNVKAGSLSRYRIGMLASYPKPDLLKLKEALTDTPILEELEILVQIMNIIEKG